MSTETAPAGWYDDPHGVEALRYWDGAKWTEHTHARVEAAPVASVSPPAAPTVASSVPPLASPSQTGRTDGPKWGVLLAVILLLAVAVIGVVKLTGGGSDAATTAEPSGDVAESSDDDGSTPDVGPFGDGSKPADPDTIPVALGSSDTAVASGGLLWVIGDGDIVSAIDTAAGTVVAEVAVGSSDNGRLAAADGLLWVTNPGSGTVSVVDPTDESVVGVIRVGPGTVDARPSHVTVLDGLAWVTSRPVDATSELDWDIVNVIDASDLSIVATIEVGSGAGRPVSVDGRVWIPNSGNDTVSVIDTATMSVVATVPVGGSPEELATVGGSVWVVNSRDASVSVIDPSTFELVATVPVGTPLGPDEYGEFPGPYSIVADGGLVWLPKNEDSTVVVIDASTYEVLNWIPVGADPFVLAAANGMAWVPNFDDDTVSVIDGSTLEVVAEIPVGNAPNDVVVADGRVWVSNAGDDTVSVLPAGPG